MLKIGIVGCGGRMGRMLLRQTLETDGVRLIGGTERPGSALVGQDLGVLAGADPIDVTVTDNPAALFAAADAVIDFTRPEATLAHAALAAETNTVLVIGTTGLEGADIDRLRDAAGRTRIVQAPNMSAGVNLLFALTRQVAATLGIAFDIEIVEHHHRHKVDAPSGTALGLGRAAAEGRGVDLDAVSDRGRDGHTGPRADGHIGFAVLRGGDVVGDHTVVFAGPGERLELTHKASDRAIYAHGALRAARWAADQPNGLYGMADVLGLG
ncbi:4-hydroxy-tetrahydrodipicolinate reductase [Roseospira visakhapatnamensis]|uniref:4-hydroxy-tetrahydrodipicolinate reductase n=1 Tax=Roseospira visakhapatnamensis TaxID=390880 RepID=A0A7W6W902_9PROT|nr:4-hydroxy-tetrahydrodipicolinate reductase [Roseospira visakhapatnamensis]MBB4265580.1 4-hydroxy-tetrahydrodipicolinate reductase [Roseospira visakhapatnamensis]